MKIGLLLCQGVGGNILAVWEWREEAGGCPRGSICLESKAGGRVPTMWDTPKDSSAPSGSVTFRDVLFIPSV